MRDVIAFLYTADGLLLEAPDAANKLRVYKQQLSELKVAVEKDCWNKGISIAATYPAELWAGELEVSNTPEKQLYSFRNFTGYYNSFYSIV
jgi:hypothetical protein